MDKTQAEKEAAKASGTATVSWKGGTRVYSREVHGEDYLALAEEFAEKKRGKVA